MKYKFKNGVEFDGTWQQILDYAKLVKEPIDASQISGGIPSGYYASATSGLLLIENMETSHIINSLNKLTVDYYTKLKKTGPVSEYLRKYVGLTEDGQIQDLFNELKKREKYDK